MSAPQPVQPVQPVQSVQPVQPVQPAQAKVGARPRVLVVEDDAAMRKLVALVLEVLDIELQLCANGAEALAALRLAPVQVLITDLMMPGVSGHDLLQALADMPALRGAARVVVFSAGLDADAAARARLMRLGAWRLLDKPVSVQALEACVREALAPCSPKAVGMDPPASARSTGCAVVDAAAAEQAAIEKFFAGQPTLFDFYRAACLGQFADDVQVGDQALRAKDGPAMRRLAHNLNSVLRMLGRETAALQAQQLDEAAVRGDWNAVAEGWRSLSRQLERWALAAQPSAQLSAQPPASPSAPPSAPG